MSPGVRTEMCPDCHGDGSDHDPDNGGAWCKCEGCDGSGALVHCLSEDCDGTLPLSEAQVEGAYCVDCRVMLDRADEEAHRDDVRRFARAI